MRWIINRKRYQPGYFLGSVLTMTAQLSLLGICMLLFRVVVQWRDTDWYRESVKLQVSTDVFAGIENENVFRVLAVVVGIVAGFVVISVCIIRRLQLEQMQKYLGIFLTGGYTRSRVFRMLGVDAGLDFLVAVPFSLVLTEYLLKVLRRKEEFLVIFSVMDVNVIMLGRMLLLCVLALYLLVAGYEWFWMRKSVKGGLASLIRQKG